MQKVGPVMLDIASTELSNEDRQVIASNQCGGVILFSRNFQSATQVAKLTQSIREIKPEILIAVDQEGGRVQRFTQGFSKLPPLSALGLLYQRDPQKALNYASVFGELMALEVQSVGCDISFSPVLDLGGELSQVIGDRAFALEPTVIIELAESYIMGMNRAGMTATGKHFPGHGSVEADSHIDVPIDNREFEQIAKLDLKPFEALADKIAGIMPAHVIYPKVDPLAAGFSSYWLQKILRGRLGFNGLIFSDDLSMKGAETAGSYCERTEQALNAGCDMVLVCNDRFAATEVLKYLGDRDFPLASCDRLLAMRMQTSPVGLEALRNTDHWQALSLQLEKFLVE